MKDLDSTDPVNLKGFDRELWKWRNFTAMKNIDMVTVMFAVQEMADKGKFNYEKCRKGADHVLKRMAEERQKPQDHSSAETEVVEKVADTAPKGTEVVGSSPVVSSGHEHGGEDEERAADPSGLGSGDEGELEDIVELRPPPQVRRRDRTGILQVRRTERAKKPTGVSLPGSSSKPVDGKPSSGKDGKSSD